MADERDRVMKYLRIVHHGVLVTAKGQGAVRSIARLLAEGHSINWRLFDDGIDRVRINRETRRGEYFSTKYRLQRLRPI